MIEVVTVNGFRKMLNVEFIVSINELRNNGRSNTAIVMSNNETVFVDDKYDSVNEMYMQAKQLNQEMGRK